MDCLLAKCIPCITDCVMAELEKLGPKYRVALRFALRSGHESDIQLTLPRHSLLQGSKRPPVWTNYLRAQGNVCRWLSCCSSNGGTFEIRDRICKLAAKILVSNCSTGAILLGLVTRIWSVVCARSQVYPLCTFLSISECVYNSCLHTNFNSICACFLAGTLLSECQRPLELQKYDYWPWLVAAPSPGTAS